MNVKSFKNFDSPEILHEDRSHNADENKGWLRGLKPTSCGEFNDLIHFDVKWLYLLGSK